MNQFTKLNKITEDYPLFKDQSADFLLAASVTNTCTIEGITQAGIPGKIPLTPTLDAEFISTGQVFSLDNIAETPKGVPTPALITRAVHLLSPFATINILNLGLQSLPQQCQLTDFALSPSASITDNAAINAKQIFEKGQEFAAQYNSKSDYIILGESTPSGTTTANAAATVLDYKTYGLFSSSFKQGADSIKDKTITAALSYINPSMNNFEKLSVCADNMLMFNAGFVSQISLRFPVLLAGGTQMAAVLLIMDKLLLELELDFNPSNIYLATTQWIADDKLSDIKGLLNQLSFNCSAYYSEFDFNLSTHPALSLYDQGEAKEGVGAGAAIAYAFAHGVTKQQITSQVEKFLLG
jgi:uncharacterized protein (TIGR00303 family)